MPEATKPWYKNPWIWGTGGVLIGVYLLFANSGSGGSSQPVIDTSGATSQGAANAVDPNAIAGTVGIAGGILDYNKSALGLAATQATAQAATDQAQIAGNTTVASNAMATIGNMANGMFAETVANNQTQAGIINNVIANQTARQIESDQVGVQYAKVNAALQLGLASAAAQTSIAGMQASVLRSMGGRIRA